ncbi:MAG TPA: iron-containing redox enzyme family protein [Candidatus Cybelea sp.]|nr:iron-containing redox enzyme family protein [Candidatus Cybelea sp.]
MAKYDNQRFRKRLLDLYDLFPFERHPYWQAVHRKELSYEEVLRAEVQHYLRTKSGQRLRRYALESARGSSPAIFELLLQTYLEECTTDASGPSHLELIQRLLLDGGVTKATMARARNQPGNAAAIALYRDITYRGAACHMLGAGVVEFFYSKLAPQVFKDYTSLYGMTASQAATYALHGPMDATHAERAFAILDEGVRIHGSLVIENSVRDAFTATSLHYDGMWQAAKRRIEYWDGRS